MVIAGNGNSGNGATDWSGLIRALRQKTGMTQERLASHLGVTTCTINRWEMGHSCPNTSSRKILTLHCKEHAIEESPCP